MGIGIGLRHWLFGCLAGFSIFLGLCFFAGNKSLEKTIEFIMLPGAAISSCLGVGRDDIQGVLLYPGGNALFFILVFVLLFRLLLGPARTSNSFSAGK